jgi:hypothetical protein
VVHALVLDDEVRHAAAGRERIVLAREDVGQRFEHAPSRLVAVGAHLVGGRPRVDRGGARGGLVGRIDAAREEGVEARVERAAAERAADDLRVGERGQVAEVEDQRVAQRDGALEPRAVVDEREELVSAARPPS